MNLRLTLALLAVFGTMSSEGARILAVFPIFSKSHQIVLQAITKTLAGAGHQLRVYSPFRLKTPHPNYTEVILNDIPTEGDNIDELFLRLTSMPHWKCLDNLLPLHDQFIHTLFNHEKIKQLVQSNEKFDLVITETFVAQEFTTVFGHIFNAPVIGIQTFLTNSILNLNLGNSLSMTSIPDGCAKYTNQMTFVERFINSFAILRGVMMYYNDYIPTVENKMRKYFPNSPPLLELTKKVSLMFINDHQFADYAQPRPPNMIPVGGIHLEPVKPLPKDIKKFMDEAKEGVILLSLGTLVPEDLQPKQFFDMWINVFKNFRQKVLWKTKKDTIEGLPDNVMTVKWMPQRDVLAHPNCVLFITHGGLGGMIETIDSGVPVVGIPHFADQHRNVAFYHANEVGVRVFLADVSEKTLTAAVRTVLENTKYRENMKRLSRIFNDRPLTPAQSVVFWTEYVLRHGGAPHLRPASTELSWSQLALLDVVAAVLAAVVVAAAASYLVLRKIIVTIQGRSVLKTKKKNN